MWYELSAFGEEARQKQKIGLFIVTRLTRCSMAVCRRAAMKTQNARKIVESTDEGHELYSQGTDARRRDDIGTKGNRRVSRVSRRRAAPREKKIKYSQNLHKKSASFS